MSNPPTLKLEDHLGAGWYRRIPPIDKPTVSTATVNPPAGRYQVVGHLDIDQWSYRFYFKGCPRAAQQRKLFDGARRLRSYQFPPAKLPEAKPRWRDELIAATKRRRPSPLWKKPQPITERVHNLPVELQKATQDFLPERRGCGSEFQGLDQLWFAWFAK